MEKHENAENALQMLLAQITLDCSSVEENLRKIIACIAGHLETGLFLFPELALSGYRFAHLRGLTAAEIDEALDRIRQALAPGQCAVVGAPRIEENRYYNSAFVLFPDKETLTYDKITLTEADAKFFEAGAEPLIFSHRGHRFGVLICRDQNNVELIGNYRGKVDAMLHLAAHYYLPETAIRKDDKNVAFPIVRAIDSDTLWCKVNTVGHCGESLSLGSSLIALPDGTVHRQAGRFDEERLLFALD
ncbi:carbon-nitrogen hydrolase family protein [Nitratifractor sp.]|uniref:carbon-nitrogen hydrolase family protein n=1 Tax=Nitratifractor sp. TaxID=2268144 RepID=UPI0025D0DE0C|nr:carbon-nitrogen hydrolase family protein [Nitratifractor sp.]